MGSNTHPWRAREREPIMGSGAEPRPSGGSGAEPLVRGQQGAKPSAADEVFVFKTVMFNASATVLHEMMYCLSCIFVK